MDNVDFNSGERIASQSGSYNCTSCGGAQIFDPRTQVMSCPFCGASDQVKVEIRPIRDYDLDLAEVEGNINWGTLKKVFHCNNCGADSVVDGNTTSSFCAFCGSSQISGLDESAGMAPEGLIPFKITKTEAVENFTKWIKKRFFAPGALKNTYRKQSVSGAYIPFWSYSADSNSRYMAEAGRNYYVTERRPTRKDGKTEMTEQKVKKTEWRRVSGSYRKSFRDVLVDASRKLKSSIMNRVMPYNLGDLVPYAPGFLAGFLAEKYSTNLADGWTEAQNRMDRELERAVKKHINADEIRGLSLSTSYNNRRYKYVLLPLWLSSYTYKGKIYHFMVNGQTGKVSGDAPVSPGKIVALIAAVAVIIALVVFLAT